MIQRIVDLALNHLGMEVAYVSHIADGHEIFEISAGAGASFGLQDGDSVPLGATYCAQMLDGRIPNAIPDTAAEPRVSRHPTTIRARIGAYIGVPLRLPDGTIYGSLCCASHHAEPSLGQRDVEFMRLLAELVAEQLDAEQQREKSRDLIQNVISDNKIAMALQPVISLVDGRRLGVEALARFPDDIGPPQELFRRAATVRLGVELEQLAATRAFALLGWLHAAEFLALNVSPGAIAGVARIVDHSGGAEWGRLVFEMTEHEAVDQYGDLRRTLEPLREQGLRIAIDDAGAGYASLYHIVQLRPDIIKIDRKLVDGAAEDSTRRTVIRGFVQLAGDIGAMVVGEGVERTEDLMVLRDLGVDCAQGYLLGRPTLDYAYLRRQRRAVLPVQRTSDAIDDD